MKETSLTASALLGLALLQLDGSETCAAGAAQLVAESLSLRLAMSEPLPLTSSLIGAAMLALCLGDAARAARLLGAVDAALAAIAAPVESEMRVFHERARAESLGALGPASLEKERASGARWSIEDAVRVALDEVVARAEDASRS
jgi:hypothetical protein